MGKVSGGVQVAAKMWDWDSDFQSQSTPQVNSIPSYIYSYIFKNFKKRRGKENTLGERIPKPSYQGVYVLVCLTQTDHVERGSLN